MIYQKRFWFLFAFLLSASLPCILYRGTIRSVSSLYPNSYFLAGHSVLVYIKTPFIVLSGYLLLLLPGLLLALALNSGRRLDLWFARALGLSIAVISLAVTLMQHWIGQTISGNSFIVLILALSVFAFVLLFVRILRGDRICWPLEKDGRQSPFLELGFIIGIAFLLVIALAPKVFWENLNGDGAHLLESSRLLLFHPLPFWSESAGGLGTYPGITSMLSVYPVSLMLRLYGVCEASARLPFLLYASGLFAVLLSLIRQSREKLLTRVEIILIASNVILYAVVASFNITYNVYMADIALPAGRETLCMFCFLSYVVSFLRKEKLWMIFFLFLTFLILPTTQLLIGLWLLSAVLVIRPRPWNEIIQSGIVFAGCLVMNAVAPLILNALQLPPPGSEFSMEGLRHRLGIGFPVPHRVLYWVVPCGILPVFSLLAWPKQDGINRALSLVTVGYFVFFAVQKHTALNHFVPVMVLPVVIFWRTQIFLGPPYRKRVLLAAAVCVLTSIILSLPRHFGPDQSGRIIGAAIEDKTKGYDSMDPGAFAGAQILSNLFPSAWDKEVPLKSYGGSWNVWYYYAHHTKHPVGSINYVLQPPGDGAPDGGTLISKNEHAALYVLSKTVWDSHKNMRPAAPVVSWFYIVPRKTLFAGYSP